MSICILSSSSSFLFVHKTVSLHKTTADTDSVYFSILLNQPTAPTLTTRTFLKAKAKVVNIFKAKASFSRPRPHKYQDQLQTLPAKIYIAVTETECLFPLQPTRESGGASLAPPAASRGRAPAENGFWRILKPTERPFLYVYGKNLRGTICISVPLLLSMGDFVSHVPRDVHPCLEDKTVLRPRPTQQRLS